ncbi:MAG: type II toxin-antitoxin system RelE/ParE family toxin [Thermosynechococcaceae cyanobacterium MS004]|nr:type II toxin-antitoxin system RelE/ParE family toxin [Thermosynechococcaceae cyanobacterium MS004]
MNRYRLSRQAEIDLETIWAYFAEQDDIAADLMLSKILNKLPMLAQFPEMGRQREDLVASMRSFPIKPYIVFYRRMDIGIEIFRVLHQSRDIEHQF